MSWHSVASTWIDVGSAQLLFTQMSVAELHLLLSFENHILQIENCF